MTVRDVLTYVLDCDAMNVALIALGILAGIAALRTYGLIHLVWCVMELKERAP